MSELGYTLAILLYQAIPKQLEDKNEKADPNSWMEGGVAGHSAAKRKRYAKQQSGSPTQALMSWSLIQGRQSYLLEPVARLLLLLLL